MDLCGSMRIQSINGQKYILVIVDDYYQFTWVKFLCSKDEIPEFMIKFLKMIQVRLNATVRNIRTDNGTEFVNQTLRTYYEDLMFDEYFNPPPIVAFPVPTFVAPVPIDLTGSPFSNLVDQDAPSLSTSQTHQESQSLVASPGVEE
ncbi:retrovirus-related pol polyprotein from transposon TNT 1-94 [Tanacetum coccineum]